jgi:hypothetical protein
MITLKKENTELEVESLYSVINLAMADNSHTNLLSNRQFSQGENPQLRSRIAPVRLLPLNAGGYQEIPHADQLVMERKELLLARRQLFQEPKSDEKLSLARQNRTKGHLGPLTMSGTELGRTDPRRTPPPLLHILHAWANLA